MQILFYDATSPVAYDGYSLDTQPLRGTEATIIRVATALAKNHEVSVAVGSRDKLKNVTVENVNYISTSATLQLKPDIVILLREKDYLETITKQFPNSKHYFWLHNLPPKNLYEYTDLLLKYQYQIIAVSNYHAGTIKNRLTPPWYKKPFYRLPQINIHTIYNPVEHHQILKQKIVNKNQLVFASSPYKGLDESITRFNLLRKTYSNYYLKVILPEQMLSKYQSNNHIHFIPEMPCNKLAEILQESFCVFYPQTHRVETFGLIYAEANAIGTPVLAHDFGSAREILSSPTQLINGNKQLAINEKIAEWRSQRPTLAIRDEFKIANVLRMWEKVLSM